MNKLFYALFSVCLLTAGNLAYAQDDMGKDAMKMDAMSKDDMNKGAMKMDGTHNKAMKKDRKQAMKKDAMEMKGKMEKAPMGKVH